MRDVEHRQFRGLRPALHRHLSTACVESDRDSPGIVAGGLLDERRIAHGGSSNNDAGDAFFQPRLDGRSIADSTAQLDGDADRLQDPINGCTVHWHAGERTIKVDNMKIFESLLLERARLCGRLAMENGGASHITLLKTNSRSFLEVDRRKKNHGFHFKKFVIKARPSRWLFSGWNCEPIMFSRPTMAVTGHRSRPALEDRYFLLFSARRSARNTHANPSNRAEFRQPLDDPSAC